MNDETCPLCSHRTSDRQMEMHLRSVHGAERAIVGDSLASRAKKAVSSEELTSGYSKSARKRFAVKGKSQAKPQPDPRGPAARKILQCTICEAPVRHDRMARHVKRVHGHVAAAPQESRNLPNPFATTPSRSRVKLTSLKIDDSRGTRINEFSKCAACRRKFSFVFRYKKTNFGEVHLCSRCKDEALSQRGNPDAWHKRYR